MEDPAHLRALFGHLLIRHGWLVGSFAMLRPMVKNKQLSDRLSKSAKSAGTRLVLRALFNSCVLDAQMLFKGRKNTNPSIRRLVQPFLPEYRHENPDLLTQLAFLKYPKNKNLRRRFERVAPAWIEDLAVDWARLDKTSEDFHDLRKRQIREHAISFCDLK
jgi:hypothetical protein